jgi:hypothetical protein
MKRKFDSIDPIGYPHKKKKRKRKPITKITTSTQTICMTLQKAIISNNSKKVINKLNEMVPLISSATKITSYFLNWYANEYKQLFPLPKINPENHIQLILKLILYQSHRILESTRDKYKILFESIEIFLTKYPNFKLKYTTEIHGNVLLLASKQIITNLNLFHLQYFDSKFLLNKIKKAIVSFVINKTLDKKDISKNIKKVFTEQVETEYSTLIQLKLNTIKDYSQEEKYDMIMWLTQIQKEYTSTLRNGYFYPMARLKDNLIAIDLCSFLKLMNCGFSEIFGKYTKDTFLQKTTNIRTDGLTVQFVTTFYCEKATYVHKDCNRAFDKPTFDLIKKYKKLPQINGTRLLTQVSKIKENREKLIPLGKSTIDPGKNQVYTILNSNGKTVAMSKQRLKHLRLIRVFQKIENKNRKEIQFIFDELSECLNCLDYLSVIHTHFSTLRKHYGTKTTKKLRFKKFQLEQKIIDLMYKEIQLGECLETNNIFKKKIVKKKYKIKQKNVIYYGDGSYSHNTRGCESIMNKKLVYALSRKTLVLVTPEFRTSKLCCKCHLNETWKSIPSRHKLRLRQCPHCLVTLDRDVNAVYNIMQIVDSYLEDGKKPKWQEKTR